jgi:lipopolysaccharide biosynthesis protein
MNKLTCVAYYLGQFHPIPENDGFWGEGFTEWHNVARARALFPGHNQPRIPGRFGFYDLRCVDTLSAQIDYAREIGIAGFCFWHYWFAGKRLLHRPLDAMLGLSFSVGMGQ